MKETINFDALMRANVARVFSERDVGRRRAALEELYTDDAKLYELTAYLQAETRYAAQSKH